MKRPLNVDLRCDLRVIGQSKPSFIFDSDEGDGYTFCNNYSDDDKYKPDLKSYHLSEWVEQLKDLITILKSKEIQSKVIEEQQ